ncbi:MAG: Tm-1-like ATP-binding domain-containing protein [Thermodesulfobacteriota bacterium]
MRPPTITGKLNGIISIGGTTGTQMGTSIMMSLPFGVLKFAMSSTASLPGFASRCIGTADIVLMHSVVEIAGLNNLMRNVLARAAGAICGMVEGSTKVPLSLPGRGEKPFIAMTLFGPCEECAKNVRKRLEGKGYQVIGFSAAGIGDRAMKEIIERQDIFGAVIDLAPGGVGEELLGFTRAAGSTRLEAAGEKGIPQIIAPCGINWGSPRKRDYKPECKVRKKRDYDAARTFVRLSKDEMIRVADAMAGKLNKALGPVRVVIPLGGWSSLDSVCP